MKTVIAFIFAFAMLALLQFHRDIAAKFRRTIKSQRGSTQTEGNYLSDIVRQEAPNHFSREIVTVKSGESLSLGSVIGKILLGTCPTTGSLVSGATGGGTCTDVTAGAKAKLGTYTLKNILAQTGAGIFSVEDPDGYALPNAVAGQAYTNDQINFTINDGSPDYALGDTFTITIAAGSGEVVAFNPDAVDGSQNAYGIMTAAVVSSSPTSDGVAIVREASIIEENLVWPDMSPEISDGQIAAAMAQLAAKNIIPVAWISDPVEE